LSAPSVRALLALQAHTLFEISPRLRMLRSLDPDQSPPPQFYMSGGEDGWIAYVREEIDDAQVRAVDEMVRREPPLRGPGATPRFAEEYRDIFGGAPLTDHNYGPFTGCRAGCTPTATRRSCAKGRRRALRWSSGSPAKACRAACSTRDLSIFRISGLPGAWRWRAATSPRLGSVSAMA